MKHLESIDHIGYAVRDIQETAAPYVAAGWELSDVYNEEVQHARIAFLKKDGMPTIELVSPLDGPSPVDKFLENGGVQPYHICYVVEDMWATLEDLHKEDFIPLFMPVPSVAMENREICYLYHETVGLIEVVKSE
jgi:methylmalonyl-CoA/ethylmalonyl-CoA epimerase